MPKPCSRPISQRPSEPGGNEHAPDVLHHLRTELVGGIRGHQQGASDAAHAADVGRELDPWHRAGRRDRDRGHRARRHRLRAGLCRGCVRGDERGRRVRGHGQNAQDVQAPDRARVGTLSGRREPERQRCGARRRHRMTGTFSTIIQLIYLAAASCFVLGLHLMNNPATARRGNQVSVAGMAAAIVATGALVIHDGVIDATGWIVIAAGVLVGGGLGLYTARTVKMTAMPQLVSVFNAVGGGAAALVAIRDFMTLGAGVGAATSVPTVLDVIIGSVTFSGSIIAAGKLQGVITSAPVTIPGARIMNLLLALVAVGGGGYVIAAPSMIGLGVVIAASLIFGVSMVMPIGGADMPVVISLLNAFTGTAVAMAGFVLQNATLVIAGALVGASGSILTKLMADAMNRSVVNIIADGFGTGGSAAVEAAGGGETVKSIAVDDAALQLAYANKVIIVPGYGLAAAQAQHECQELGKLLEERGIEVSYAIHPVAGRMPGHMNVLLAEANVPYDQLKEMDDVNREFSRTDVSLVIGANDVTNPDARNKADSPIYGMPILNVDESRSVIILKRSMNSGFAGIDNPLFYGENTAMLFGDAKSSVSEITEELKAL